MVPSSLRLIFFVVNFSIKPRSSISVSSFILRLSRHLNKTAKASFWFSGVSFKISLKVDWRTGLVRLLEYAAVFTSAVSSRMGVDFAGILVITMLDLLDGLMAPVFFC